MPNEPADRIIRYAKVGVRITLEMHQEDYENILMLCGYYAGQIAGEKRPAQFWKWIEFVNRLNEHNPSFQKYDIPEEYRTRV